MFRINKKRKIIIICIFVAIFIGGGLYLLYYLSLQKAMEKAMEPFAKMIVDDMIKDPAFWHYSFPGRRAEERDEYEKAINHYQKGIEKYPNDIRLKLDLGRAFLKVDREEEAKKLFEEILLLDPKDVDAHLGLAFYYVLKEKDFEQGAKELKLFLELAPPDHRERKKAEEMLEELKNLI